MLNKVNSQRGFAPAPVIIAVLLLAAIFFGTNLVQQRQSTTPQADEPPLAFTLPDGNMAQDNSFENSVPGVWTPLGPNWAFDFNDKLDGTRSIRLDNTGDNPGMYQRVYFKPNTKYTWLAIVKTKDNKRNRMVIAKTPGAVQPVQNVSAVNQNGNNGFFILSDVMTLGSTDWHYITASFRTDGTAGIGDFYINLQGRTASQCRTCTALCCTNSHANSRANSLFTPP